MNIEQLQSKEYFTTGDAAKICGVPEYTIRYWEKSFGLIKPIRKESLHRRYTKSDINTILKIKDLIYRHKMTLEGAKKHLNRFMSVGARPKSDEGLPTARDVRFLKEIKETLSQLIKE